MKPHYFIIFDTNTLIFGSPINKAASELIKKFSVDSRLKITFSIPEIVKKEVEKHIHNEVKKAEQNYNNSITILNTFANLGIKGKQVKKSEIDKFIEFLIKKYEIKILKTPIKKINLSEIIDSAVFYKLPFSNKTNEKGFKDSIIARTIVEQTKSLSKQVKIVFICNDEILREHLSTLFSQQLNFKTYPSIPDFTSDLDSDLSNIDEKRIQKLRLLASKAFGDKSVSNSLFTREDLAGKIYSQFNDHFTNIATQVEVGRTILGQTESYKKYEPTAPGKFEVTKLPVFINNDEERFIWSTTIVYRRNYKEKVENVDVSHRILISFDEDVEYVIEFEIKWETTVSITDEIIDYKLIDISLGSKSIKTRPYSIPGFSSGATLSGQGTFPIDFGSRKEE